MTTSEREPAVLAVDVTFDDELFTVVLSDGRRISAPIAWFPRLRSATPGQREHWRLIGKGIGIHWPEVDEDISVAGMLRGSPGTGASRAS